MEAAIVDASVAVKWLLQEPGSEQARLLSRARLEAPDLLPVECANILWKKVRLRDLSREEALARLQLLLQAPVSLAGSRMLLEPALEMSFELRHPVYDCVYLALALQRQVPLITADERLAAAVRKVQRLAGHVLLLASVQ
jgi:predicted nucleic acid-binding protein